MAKQVLIFCGIKVANFCQEVLNFLGSYTWVFTVLLVRFFIFCGVVLVVSYVFKSFVLRHGDFTRTQHQETTIQMPLIQFITCKYESFLFPRDSMFPGKNYHRCQRVLSFLISDISMRTGLYHPTVGISRTDHWSQGKKRTNLRRGSPRLTKHKTYWLSSLKDHINTMYHRHAGRPAIEFI